MMNPLLVRSQQYELIKQYLSSNLIDSESKKSFLKIDLLSFYNVLNQLEYTQIEFYHISMFIG